MNSEKFDFHRFKEEAIKGRREGLKWNFKRERSVYWTVAPWNKAGQKRYERLSATENSRWLNDEWKLYYGNSKNIKSHGRRNSANTRNWQTDFL